MQPQWRDWMGIINKYEPHETPDLPHAGSIAEQTVYGTDFIKSVLYFHKLTLKDAYFELKGCQFLLKVMWDKQLSERLRFAEGIQGVNPISDLADALGDSEEVGGEVKSNVFITRDDILTVIATLNPRREAQCQNQIVAKGTLTVLAKTLNQLLVEGQINKNKKYLFSSSLKRYAVITDWINWYFDQGYGIKSNYNPEQIRQLITKDNNFSGQQEMTFLTEIYLSRDIEQQTLPAGVPLFSHGRDGTLAN